MIIQLDSLINLITFECLGKFAHLTLYANAYELMSFWHWWIIWIAFVLWILSKEKEEKIFHKFFIELAKGYPNIFQSNHLHLCLNFTFCQKLADFIHFLASIVKFYSFITEIFHYKDEEFFETENVSKEIIKKKVPFPVNIAMRIRKVYKMFLQWNVNKSHAMEGEVLFYHDSLYLLSIAMQRAFKVSSFQLEAHSTHIPFIYNLMFHF